MLKVELTGVSKERIEEFEEYYQENDYFSGIGITDIANRVLEDKEDREWVKQFGEWLIMTLINDQQLLCELGFPVN